MVNVRISCPVNPSESDELVLEAVLRIFPDASLSRTDEGYEGVADDIGNLSLLIRQQRILDAARSVVFGGMCGDTTEFTLNKQAASVGKVSFCPEDTVLGAIKVCLNCEDLEDFIDIMLPRTVDGQEVIP
ncbi:MAG: hypothetical protein ACOX1N_02225 [Candidatus Methanomethylophilaceae archaeon]|jgi:predicted RNA binding protein with dsRBD fold (UPF0201 family)